MKTSTIAISMLDTGPARMARVKRNDETVAQYANDIAEGADMPPVVVWTDGKTYWLSDGLHRCGAHEAAGVKTIKAEVRQGTWLDAVRHAVGANAQHGLARSQADKWHAVEQLLGMPQFGDLSSRELAALARVSHTFIIKVKGERASKQEPAADGTGSDLMDGAGRSSLPASVPPAVQAQRAPGPAVVLSEAALSNGMQPAAVNNSSGGVNNSTPADALADALGVSRTVEADSDEAGDEAQDADSAPVGDEDDLSDADLIADLSAQLRRAESRLAELEASLKATNQGDEVLRLRTLLDTAERRRDEAMSESRNATLRATRYLRTLQSIGRLVGQEDQDKILAAVRAAVAVRDAA